MEEVLSEGSQPGTRKVVYDNNHVVKSGPGKYDFLPLCSMCKKQRITCDSPVARLIEIPLEPNDPTVEEIKSSKDLPDGVAAILRDGTKLVDGVKAGIIKSEEDFTSAPLLCAWFTPKDPG